MTIERASAAAQARLGEKVTLVRWINTKDGWVSETVQGIYQGRSRQHWFIRTQDQEKFPRAEWELCRP